MGGGLDEVRVQLEQIAGQLGDLALDRLREAVDAGAGIAPAAERLITRARRSVEKAAALLEQAAQVEDGK